MLQLNELDEIKLAIYENVKLYKKKVKCWPGRKIVPRAFEHGQVVLLYNS